MAADLSTLDALTEHLSMQRPATRDAAPAAALCASVPNVA